MVEKKDEVPYILKKMLLFKNRIGLGAGVLPVVLLSAVDMGKVLRLKTERNFPPIL